MTLISTYDMPLRPPYYGTPGTPGDNPEKIQTNEFYYVAKACHTPSDSPGKLASYVEGKPRGAMSSQAEQLRQAAATGNLDQVRALLKTGAKVEPDLEGRTALHLASANGHVAIVKALIEGGAKINALDAAGYSPLHQAATEGHEEVVKLLLKNGCHVDTQDELHGNTALHEAAWKGFSRTLEILCKNKANFYIKNNGGFTPLHLACQNGHNQCCRVLLLSACKPDVRNSYGDTPLHTAARYGHAGVLRILISAFCNVNETNKNGDTALHISAAMGRSKLTRILLEAGCDQKIRNNQGEMARDIAERKEFTEVVKLMDNPPVTLIHVEQQTKKHSKSSKKREKDSNTSQDSGAKDKKDKHKKSKKHHKVHFSDKEKKGNISPYGCHMYPDMNYFPSLKLKSLPQEPLQSGEQYYADLAGNIKKGPRGLGYMCYCAPFFNHVEKKLDANKKELFDHIDSRNEDLKAKINHLEQRTHDQLFSLNQKMKESLALERSECAERIDRRLFRERRELEQQQENCVRKLQCEMKSMLGRPQNGNRMNGHCESALGNGNVGYHIHNGNQPLLRSKSEDLLSETNSNHNSVSLMSSTVTGISKFTNTSNYQRTYLNPAQCGTRPKNNNISNISSKMRCLGYPELKCESKSEGDLTSCHAERNGCESKLQDVNVNYSVRPPYATPMEDRHLKSTSKFVPHQERWNANATASGILWKNTQYGKFSGADTDNKSGFQSDTSKSHYMATRPTYCTNHNHDQNRSHIADSSSHDHKNQAQTPTNGLQATLRDGATSSGKQSGNSNERSAMLPGCLENDGSSFV
ncbi:ankyrin repeat domain-containing protein 6 [Trichonephila inaurata madagascariensis]|uniref:Ankyrin repeat domain-containing protein 6 n=1 Tax=Trichonephila inaurata madagascariensis TaxID=2747483 RepID=A0A8X6WRF8_9ARAC|nr:ankyrin repeat domain-containing protein 6 [Trichonephila inaurata madagascariensis]